MWHPLDMRMKAIVAALVDISLREIVFLRGLIERGRRHGIDCGHPMEYWFKPDSWVYKLIHYGEPMNEDRDVLMSFKYLANHVLLRFFDSFTTDFSEFAERAIGGIKYWNICGPSLVYKSVLVSEYFSIERNKIRPHINNKMPRKSQCKVTTILHNYPEGDWTDIFL